MKGIILAGGRATRLYPITQVICKQLLPVYDKPLIHYSLSVVMLSGIRDILFISTPRDLPRFKELFGSGSQLGLRFSYAIQDQPRGLPDAFRVGARFIGGDSVCLVLGDNIFYGDGMAQLLREGAGQESGATIFACSVRDPGRYGVVEFDEDLRVLSIQEKPDSPRSNYAVVGLYFYDNEVVRIADGLKPSGRGELEISDVNRRYLEEGRLSLRVMGRGCVWLDAGTPESLVDAALLMKTIEERQGLKVSCVEEIAYRMGYIDEQQLRRLAEPLMKSGYGQYLIKSIDQRL